jgi:Flp pilus assembly protein TadG
MWRLTRNPGKSAEQAETEHGAISVLVALLSVALIVIVAMVADAGMVYAERAQLQNGADSAALAVAGKCSISGSVCDQSTANTLASGLTNGNANDGAGAVALDFGVSGQVTATTTTVDGVSHAGFLSLPLGTLTGLGQATVNAKATAVWGGLVKGPAPIPLAVGACQVTANMRDKVDAVIVINGDDKCSSTNPSGLNMPGGFGWLNTTGGCTPLISVNDPWATSKTGASIPSGCDSLFNSSLVGQKVLVPVFDYVDGHGSGGGYHITGWAVLVIAGWNFPSTTVNWPAGNGTKGFFGHFTETISYAAGFTYGGTTTYGATAVHLTK